MTQIVLIVTPSRYRSLFYWSNINEIKNEFSSSFSYTIKWLCFLWDAKCFLVYDSPLFSSLTVNLNAPLSLSPLLHPTGDIEHRPFTWICNEWKKKILSFPFFFLLFSAFNHCCLLIDLCELHHGHHQSSGEICFPLSRLRPRELSSKFERSQGEKKWLMPCVLLRGGEEEEENERQIHKTRWDMRGKQLSRGFSTFFYIFFSSITWFSFSLSASPVEE